MHRITRVQVELCISHIEKTIAKSSTKFVIFKTLKCQTISLKPLIIQIWLILSDIFYDLGIMVSRKNWSNFVQNFLTYTQVLASGKNH